MRRTAAGQREIDLQVAQAIRLDRERVLGERDRVGMFAGRDRAEPRLVEAQVRAARGERAQRLFDADALLRSDDAAVHGFGTRHRSPERLHQLVGFVVGRQRPRQAGVDVVAVRFLRVFIDGRIAGLVRVRRRLRGDDGAELANARHVAPADRCNARG